MICENGPEPIKWAKEEPIGADDCNKCHGHHEKTVSQLGDLGLEVHRIMELVKQLLNQQEETSSALRDRLALVRVIKQVP